MSGEASSAAAAPLSRLERLRSALEAAVPGQIAALASHAGELSCEVRPAQLLALARALRDGDGLKFEMCMDVCGVDYLEHGRAEWKTEQATLSDRLDGLQHQITALNQQMDERLAALRGESFERLSLAAQEALWQEVKRAD